jgi:hypothetical protein
MVLSAMRKNTSIIEKQFSVPDEYLRSPIYTLSTNMELQGCWFFIWERI